MQACWSMKTGNSSLSKIARFTIEGYDAIRIQIFAILIELLKFLKEISLHGMIDGGETSCGSR